MNVAGFLGPGGIPLIATVFGNPQIKSERALSYQAGYRAQLSPKFSMDVAIFYTDYSGLVTTQTGAPFLETLPAPTHLISPQIFQNLLSGGSDGVEAAAKAGWKVFDPRDRF